MLRPLLLALGLAAIAPTILVSSARADVAISTCAATVPAGETGILQNDLVDCNETMPAVFLHENATIDLAGHSISSGGSGVFCFGRRCTIVGPGEITGAENAGISAASDEKARVTVDGVDIHDNLGDGIALPSSSKLFLSSTTITSNGADGVSAHKGRLKGENVVISGNAGTGLRNVKKFTFKTSAIENNGSIGIVSSFGKGRLVSSTLSGNNADDPNGTLDIATLKKPRLVDSTCERSGIIPPSLTLPSPLDPGWGVCTND